MSDDPPWYATAGVEDILLTAPPGCGKTHQLAHYTQSLIARQVIEAPQQILAITFSTKARTNLRARIDELASVRQRRRVHVTNFHGMSYRLYRAHAATLDLDPGAYLPQPGWLAKHRAAIAAEFHANRYDLKNRIDEAKRGPFDQEEVLDRLERIAGAAGVAYELGLREANRLDYPDAIRHALRLLETPAVARLYQCRFPLVVIDECQDLTRDQFRMAELLSGDGLVLAGDRAQGIYGWASADPAWVYDQMADRRPRRIKLHTSHRSAPAVLCVVSAVAVELGGEPLECASPDDWPGGGRAEVIRSPDTWAEAERILPRIRELLAADSTATIGVMARSGWRRRELEAAARIAGVDFELWDHPVHRPRVVQLLRQQLPKAVARAGGDRERLQELYNLCFEACDTDDLETADELNEAFETLEELTANLPLEQVVGDIRVADEVDRPVAPGLHFLTGHSGKGQQFDHVYVLGLEEGILPDHRSDTDEALQEDLAVLHVMVSRARRSVTVTAAADVRWNPDREWIRAESRWLPLIDSACVADAPL